MHQSIQPGRTPRDSISDLPTMHARLEVREVGYPFFNLSSLLKYNQEQGPVIAGPTWDEFLENSHLEGARDDELYVGGIRYPLNENDTIGSVENLPSASGNSQMSTTHLFDNDVPPMHDSQSTPQSISQVSSQVSSQISSQVSSQVSSQISSQGISEVTSQVASQATSHGTSQGTSQGGITSESSEGPIINGPPILHGPPIFLDEAALQILEQEVRRIEAFVEHLDGFVRHLTDRSRDPNLEYHFQEFVPNVCIQICKTFEKIF